MNTKTLISGLIGGIAFFLLGYLIYGMVLMGMMEEHCSQAMKDMSRKEADFVWWALIVSNLLGGYLLALIFSWSNTNSMSSGMSRGAMVGLLMALMMDLQFYSMTTMYSDTTIIWIDAAANVVMCGLVGAIIGWWNGRGAKPAAA
ncbi:MAG: DUF1761 family protein [Flavobacteriaceae bacterium]|nr:DUF1761 family protein [Flavobacteriaceae bacterium]